MRLVVRLVIPAAFAALTFVACAANTAAPTTAPAASAAAGGVKAAVNIKGFAYSPATLTVAKGTVVTFTNGDSVAHTVTSGANRTKDGKFDQSVAGGESTTITFDTPGTYEYFCTIHSSMKATIIVQ